MPFATAADNQALDSLAGATTPPNLIGFASLHTAYSATGTNELTGGSYTRVALSWSAAGSGSKALTGAPAAHNVPAGNTVAYVGLWSLISGGTFAGMGANGGAALAAFTSTTHTGSPADTITAPGTSYTANQTVVFFPGAGGTLPTGLTIGVVYYVVNPTGAVFQVATAASGAAINLGTGAGSGLAQAITLETFGGPGGTFQVSADTLSLI